MRTVIVSTAVASAVLMGGLLAAAPASAQRYGGGPVRYACSDDIATYCAGVPHGNMQARECLEVNRKKLSPECRRALDNTGGGRGMGRNRQGW